MSLTVRLKVKHLDKTTTVHKFNDDRTKKIAALVGTTLKEDIAAIVGDKVVESILQHNERVVAQAAVFFQRVVTRTPKDESYLGHTADTDFVWKHWKVLYWGKSVSAEEMGEDLFADEHDFDNKEKIQAVAKFIKERLFKGEEAFRKRKTRIRNIRFENKHDRFPMLEYGSYKIKNSEKIKEGPKHYHGVQNGYSVQAPYGMERITLAEVTSMPLRDFDRWLSATHNKKVTRVPSKAQMRELVAIIGNKRHLSGKDIDAIGRVYEK